MPETVEERGVSIEVLGTCMTNITPESQHPAEVQYRHLWSYAQQAALIAVSDKNNQDGCYHLIPDPERRAKRIAAHYARLYFDSAKKSGNQVQFYWPALAAFVVKDIVEAYRFTREDVLRGTSTFSKLGSWATSNASPFQHAIRTYSALAKGNLWLFMDIYPWFWFFLEYGINADGSLNKQRVEAGIPARNWSTFQDASKTAVEELPYGPNWMERLSNRLKNDAIYKKAKEYFDLPPSWTPDGGYGQRSMAEYGAHQYCRSHVKENDNGYRTPPSNYWVHFNEAFFVMDAEHIEVGRIANDAQVSEVVRKIRKFAPTPAVAQAYRHLLDEYFAATKDKTALQQNELVAIAEQEQLNVLQPLIYNDPLLKETMDLGHRVSRFTYGLLSPKFKVVYSSIPQVEDSDLEAVFDEPTSLAERFSGKAQSLPDAAARMRFVENIAAKFNSLMSRRRSYMENELRKIAQWIEA